MQDTLLANVGCLVAFQVAAADARYLMGELDRERVTEEDLVSLPVHQCYVRATAEGQRQPTYSMKVREPEAGDPEAEERVRASMVEYTTPAETIASQDAEAERLLVEFRKKLEDEEEQENEEEWGRGGRAQALHPNHPRTAHPQRPIPEGQEEAAAETEGARSGGGCSRRSVGG